MSDIRIPTSIHVVDNGIGDLNSPQQGWFIGFIEGVTIIHYEEGVDIYTDLGCNEMVMKSYAPAAKMFGTLADAFKYMDELAKEWPLIHKYAVPTPVIIYRYSTAKAMSRALNE
jgi:hypothetical protein